MLKFKHKIDLKHAMKFGPNSDLKFDIKSNFMVKLEFRLKCEIEFRLKIDFKTDPMPYNSSLRALHENLVTFSPKDPKNVSQGCSFILD